MPVYEYRCANGHVEERTERIHNRDYVGHCSVCGKRQDRQWSSANFNIKGYAEANGYSKSS